MGLRLITEPSLEPVTLAEQKTHMRVDSISEDTYIDTLITSARKAVESYTRRALNTQTWELWFDLEPSLSVIRLPFPPLLSVTHIKYYAEDDTESTFGTVNYLVDTYDQQGGRIALKEGSTWPFDLRQINGIVIKFVCGYGATAAHVPQDLRHAIKLIAAHWFENREDHSEIPVAAAKILAPYRILRI